MHPQFHSRPAFIVASPLRPASQHSLFLIAPATPAVTPRRPQPAQWTMGKVAKFGIFSPAVILTRTIIGNKRLTKLRGKGISLHSQAITAFCEFTGAGPKMRQALIREAKKNGDTLGFLF